MTDRGASSSSNLAPAAAATSGSHSLIGRNRLPSHSNETREKNQCDGGRKRLSMFVCVFTLVGQSPSFTPRNIFVLFYSWVRPLQAAESNSLSIAEKRNQSNVWWLKVFATNNGPTYQWKRLLFVLRARCQVDSGRAKEKNGCTCEIALHILKLFFVSCHLLCP